MTSRWVTFPKTPQSRSTVLNRNNSSDRQPGPCVTSSLASVLNSGQTCSTSFLRSPNEHEQPTVQEVRRSIVLRRYAERDMRNHHRPQELPGLPRPGGIHIGRAHV